MQRLGQQRPEIPIAIGRAHTRTRIALDGVVEVGEFQRIAQEEYRRIVTHQIPIARLGVEFYRKAANIAFGIGCATLARNGREADKTIGLLAHLRED